MAKTRSVQTRSTKSSFVRQNRSTKPSSVRKTRSTKTFEPISKGITARITRRNPNGRKITTKHAKGLNSHPAAVANAASTCTKKTTETDIPPIISPQPVDTTNNSVPLSAANTAAMNSPTTVTNNSAQPSSNTAPMDAVLSQGSNGEVEQMSTVAGSELNINAPGPQGGSERDKAKNPESNALIFQTKVELFKHRRKLLEECQTHCDVLIDLILNPPDTDQSENYTGQIDSGNDGLAEAINSQYDEIDQLIMPVNIMLSQLTQFRTDLQCTLKFRLDRS